MATTKPFNQPRYEAAKQLKHPVLAASVTLPGGTLVMNDAGQLKPFTDTGHQGGASLVGWANGTFTNPTASPLTRDPMLFFRDCPANLLGKGGDAPTLADVGKKIALADNNTCKKTIATDDKQVTLLEVLGGNRFLVWLE